LQIKRNAIKQDSALASVYGITMYGSFKTFWDRNCISNPEAIRSSNVGNSEHESQNQLHFICLSLKSA
jgi:hypothetical protein